MIDINTNIRMAVAGCGSAGRSNIRIFSGLDDVEIVACCDNDEQLAEFTAREFGIPAFHADLKDMLDEEAVDALVVALPDGGHLEAAVDALGRGISVFCETPLASNYAEAVEMTRAARESGLTAMVNFGGRSNPLVSSVIKAVEGGRIGRVRYFEAALMQNRLDSRILDDPREEKRLLWRLSSEAGSAGALGELGAFLYDIVYRCCGEPSELSASIANIAGFDNIEEYQELDLTAGDTFICQLGFKGGAAGLLRGSWTVPGEHEQLTITVYGEDGVISLDTSRSEAEYRLNIGGQEELVKVDPGIGSGLAETFLSAVRGDASPSADFDYGLRIQYYIEQSRLSAEGGLRLDVGDGTE